MLCALFKSYLLIAAPASESGPYKIRLIVNLSSVRDESSDSGRGTCQIVVGTISQ